MAKLEEVVIDLLNDIEVFCGKTLQKENLSQETLDFKDAILQKVSLLRTQFSQLKDANDDVVTEPASPPPYIDMKGNNKTTTESNTTEYVFSDLTEGHYEVCEQNSNSSEIACMDIKQHSELEESPYDGFRNVAMVSVSDMTNAVKKGFLDKKSRGLFNQYQKRWCAIKDGVLYYFAHITDSRQCGCIPLNGYEVRPMTGNSKDTKKELGFELVCPGKRTYQFLAPSKQEMIEWIEAIDTIYSTEPKNAHTLNMSPNLCFQTNKDEKMKTDLNKSDDGVYETVEEDLIMSNSSSHEHVCNSVAQSEKNLYDDAKSSRSKPPVNPEDWYLGMWDCLADEANELSFSSGDLIRIISKEYDNHSWWIGEINGRVGLVPKNFLTEAYEEVCN